MFCKKAIFLVKLVEAAEAVEVGKSGKSVELENGKWKMENGKCPLRELSVNAVNSVVKRMDNGKWRMENDHSVSSP